MKHIEAFIDEGGEVTLGAADGVECAATAADQHNALVVLVRRQGESVAALLKRLDRALGLYYETGETVDEINSAPHTSRLPARPTHECVRRHALTPWSPIAAAQLSRLIAEKPSLNGEHPAWHARRRC